jgi:DNA-binding beta-propeller fold protein YncE
VIDLQLDLDVLVLNLETMPPQVMGEIEIERGSPRDVALSPDETQAFVTINSSTGPDNVLLIDLASLAVTGNVQVESDPRNIVLSPDGDRAYVTHYLKNSVSVVDLKDRVVLDTIAISPDGIHVYVTNNGDNSMSVVELATQRQVVT